MRQFVLLLMLSVALIGLTGCVSYDPEDNNRVMNSVMKDFRVIREDLDFYLGLDRDTMLDRTEY